VLIDRKHYLTQKKGEIKAGPGTEASPTSRKKSKKGGGRRTSPSTKNKLENETALPTGRGKFGSD